MEWILTAVRIAAVIMLWAIALSFVVCGAALCFAVIKTVIREWKE